MGKKKSNRENATGPIVYGDPVYGPEEDIYDNEKRVSLEEAGDENDDIFDREINPGDDLDVPGTESDDADEFVGSEDEENNYYSIGGDNHHSREEDNDDEVKEDEEEDD